MTPVDDLILIIDDDLDLLDIVGAALQRSGYEVLKASDGHAGLAMFLQHDPCLVLLDITMPGLSGWEVCRQLREISDVPVILLTVLRRERDIVRGLKEGADDYITKPFSTGELMGRIEALLRRARMPATEQPEPRITTGELTLISESHQVILCGRIIKLTPTEFRLLSTLVKHVGRVISHRKLIYEVWGQVDKTDTRQLKVYIHYLRQKLEDDPKNPRYILSERGEGYRLVV